MTPKGIPSFLEMLDMNTRIWQLVRTDDWPIFVFQVRLDHQEDPVLSVLNTLDLGSGVLEPLTNYRKSQGHSESMLDMSQRGKLEENSNSLILSSTV